MFKMFTMTLGLIVTATTIGTAAPIYGTAADLTGNRTEDHLVTGGNYAGDTLFVGWAITDLGGGDWRYSYTFRGFGSPDVSHFILDLTDDAVDPFDPDAVTDVAINSGSLGEIEFDTYVGGGSNPGLAASIVGVKFNTNNPGSPFTVTFDSNRAPVWGDIYFKGGSGSFAHNTGLTLHGTSENPLDFVARPNGVVPEPASVALTGLGLGVLGVIRWRRKSSG